MFHAIDGWHFQRQIDGSVRVMKLKPVLNYEFIRQNSGPSPAEFVIVEDVTFDAGTWASIVASVRKGGETSESFYAAQAFHGGTSG